MKILSAAVTSLKSMFDFIGDLPHRNSSNRRSYQDYYENESKQIIAERFKATIKTFNYSF